MQRAFLCHDKLNKLSDFLAQNSALIWRLEIIVKFLSEEIFNRKIQTKEKKLLTHFSFSVLKF